MTDHCFISYSNVDAPDFARKLANKLEGGKPYIPVWFDKDDLKPGIDWDVQIDEALKSCKLLLFVMTKDSTNEKSVCKQEWSRALSYKKPIVPLWLHHDVNAPFRIGDRQRIDFRNNFDAGLAQLRDFLEWLDSPEGVLQTLKDRLSDAERDIQRASETDKPRIQADIDDLKAQIKRQEEIVKDPKAAEKKTEESIQAGLERERQPEKPVTAKTTTKFINPPPGIAPNYFQDRYFETVEIVKFLKDDAQRLMTVVGRGGVGKTAMVCRLLKALESGQLPDNLGDMKIDGIVYLSESGSHRVNFPNIFADLSKLLPSETAAKLDALYKDPKAPVANKMNALLEHFQGERVLLLLDNFEPAVDPETQEITDKELDEALCTLVKGSHHMVNALITTRVAPHDLNLCEPGRQRVLILDEGLESPFAENILREMDTDGKLGLKARAENDPLLQRARDKTRGYPRALEALFAILSSDRYTTLEELLEMPLPENVVEALVGEAFSRLDTTAQKVMQALAVYNRPVTPAAVDYLLQPHLPEIDSAPVLNRLVNMHFVRRETGQYYLHPVDHDYAFSKIPIDSPPQVGEGVGSEFTRHNLLTRGAGYFSQARKPSTEWKKLEDLNAPLAEFDLLCEAGNYDEAFHILDKIDSEYLFLWGHYRLLIGLHLRVNNKLKDKNLIFRNLNGLGLAYSSQGQIEEAIAFYETGLYIAREIKNKLAEGVFLGNLGNAYRDINDIQKAISVFEKRLAIARNLGDRLGEGIGLGNLGVAYARLGNLHKAIKFYKQALKINREINNLRSEGVTLGRLGAAYATLSNNQKAMGYYEQALEIARKIGDRRNLASWLGNLGSSYANLGDVGNAIKFYEQALVIEQEINDRHGKGTTLSNLGLAFIMLGQIHKAIEFSEQALEIAKDIGDRSDEGKRLVHLGNCYAYLGETSKAIKYYEQGLAIDREIGNRSDEATAIGNVGLALLGNNEYEKSIENFKKAIQIADEISYPIVQNEERWGLAQAYLFQNDLVNARTTIEAALQYDIPQYNHNTSTLHGIIVLRQGDESTAQQVFRRAIELADEILAKTSDYYTALDAKGLALCGLALVKDLTGFTESPPAGESVRENLSGLIEQAIETFRAARKIAPHAGVVKSVLRLFDELAKCDPNGILKDVRSAVQGVE